MLNALNDALAEGKVHTVNCLLHAHPLLVSTRMHAGGWTPLLLASYYDQPEVVEVILSHAGVGVNDVDNDIFRRSALHWLAARGQAVLIFKLVKQRGATVDLRDAENNTPLHRACKANHPMAVMMLLMLGADPEARTEDEEVPAEVTDSSLARAFIRLSQKSCLKSTSLHKGRIGGEMYMAPVSSTSSPNSSSNSGSSNRSNSSTGGRRSLRQQQQQQHGEKCLDKSGNSSSSSGSCQSRSESPCTRSTASTSSWEEDEGKEEREEGHEEGKAGMEDETTTLLLKCEVVPSGKRNGKRLVTKRMLV
jgi:hypothetical protein|eukprot:evm.model.NODE_13969_length_38266_cov_26.164612.5